MRPVTPDDLSDIQLGGQAMIVEQCIQCFKYFGVARNGLVMAGSLVVCFSAAENYKISAAYSFKAATSCGVKLAQAQRISAGYWRGVASKRYLAAWP